MASKPDNTWNFLASLMHLAFSGQFVQAVGLAYSQVGRRWPWCEYTSGPGAGHLVGSCEAADTRHEIAEACYWLSWKVEAWASIE